MEKNLIILVIICLIALHLVSRQPKGKLYRAKSIIDWNEVTRNVRYLVNEKWNCRERVIWLANDIIDAEVQFSICYGWFAKKYAHVWIEIRGEIQDPSIDTTHPSFYYKIFELKIQRQGLITDVIKILNNRLLKGGRL